MERYENLLDKVAYNYASQEELIEFCQLMEKEVMADNSLTSKMFYLSLIAVLKNLIKGE